AGGDDCDDGAPDTHPGAPDDCYDDVDADCDGALDADCDGDGWPIGADCDDGDAAISPAAGEAAPDGVDDDCDGMIDETLLAPGDVFVSELHPDGSPWIELCSAAERDVPLDGLRLATGAGEHRLDAATLAAGACVAVCATEQDGCPLTVPGLALDAGDDLVSLDGGAVVLDAVHVTGWDREAFATWSLDAGRGAADNNAPEAWCLTEGTAGSPNPACP
ncbi:MAG: putative metal-binding motif-containing protein, partial [Myxococcota bacterium]